MSFDRKSVSEHIPLSKLHQDVFVHNTGRNTVEACATCGSVAWFYSVALDGRVILASCRQCQRRHIQLTRRFRMELYDTLAEAEAAVVVEAAFGVERPEYSAPSPQRWGGDPSRVMWQ
ncbi:MAG: hypothetical protein U0768_09595 [Anaerolineae bacterium]